MNTLRTILRYPIGLLYVAVVIYSRHAFKARRLLGATMCATAVMALAVLVALVVGSHTSTNGLR